MFGKLDYWGIYFSLAGRVALSLQDSCCEGCGRKALLPARLLLLLGGFSGFSPGRMGWTGSEQQLPSLLVCPQEDEASQADGCHPWDNTCEQA